MKRNLPRPRLRPPSTQCRAAARRAPSPHCCPPWPTHGATAAPPALPRPPPHRRLRGKHPRSARASPTAPITTPTNRRATCWVAAGVLCGSMGPAVESHRAHGPYRNRHGLVRRPVASRAGACSRPTVPPLSAAVEASPCGGGAVASGVRARPWEPALRRYIPSPNRKYTPPGGHPRSTSFPAKSRSLRPSWLASPIARAPPRLLLVDRP